MQICTPFQEHLGAREEVGIDKVWGKNLIIRVVAVRLRLLPEFEQHPGEAAAKHPTVHRTIPISRTNMHLGQKDNNAKAEKL